MKKILVVTILVAVLAIHAFAQWGGGFQFGKTRTHTSQIVQGETWHGASPNQVTSSALQFSGYNAVRVDYDLSTADTQANVNFMCSNDSIWISGDSITITEDTYEYYDLIGCEDYTFYVESVMGGADRDASYISIYTTPFNKGR